MFDHYSSFLRNKTVLISGSSQGIGKTIARTVGIMGAQVVINGTNRVKLAAACEELSALGISVLAVAGDVSSPADCESIAEAALAKFGAIDYVFANAGLSTMGTVEETKPAVFKQVMDVNFLGVVYLVKACLPALKNSKGSIMITGSVSGFRGIPGASAYCASKMALTAFAESLRIELARYRVKVSLAYVGFTENDAGKTMMDAGGNWVYRQNVARGKVASQLEVAEKMIEMLEVNCFSSVLSTLGCLNFYVNRLAPWLAHLIFKHYYQRSIAVNAGR